MQSNKTDMLNDDEIKFLEMLGYLFINQGMLDKAVKTLNAMAMIDPKNKWAVMARAVTSFLQGEYAHTIKLSDKAMKIDPDNRIELLKLKARALYRLGRNDEAKALIDEVKRIIDQQSSIKSVELP